MILGRPNQKAIAPYQRIRVTKNTELHANRPELMHKTVLFLLHHRQVGKDALDADLELMEKLLSESSTDAKDGRFRFFF